MNYDEYLKLCRNIHPQENKPSLEEFYGNSVVKIPTENFDSSYQESVGKISKLVKAKFDSCESSDIMIKHFGNMRSLLRQ